LLDWAPFLRRRQPILGKPESKSPVETPPSARTPGVGSTHLGPGSRFVGDLSGEEDVAVDGRFEGTISVAGKVGVGAGGEVRGDVQARQVVVSGRVQGQVIATERAELTSSAVVEGSVQAPKIVIAEGARLEGNVATSPANPQASGKGSEG
jgi:cytoskeletal protein CcmA (bactofilin family)